MEYSLAHLNGEYEYGGPEAARRLIMQGPAATNAAWERVQRARCREDAPHPRRLVIPKRGGRNETVVCDLGPCRHNP